MTDWFIVVERWKTGTDEALPPYVVGPYPDEATAETEGNSEAGLIHSLLTVDAKSEGYQAVECFWTDEPPEGERIIPSILVSLKVDNVYELHGTITVEHKDVVINPPPPGTEDGEEEYDEWAYSEIFEPFTGTGRPDGDAGYFVEVTASNLPNLLAVGTKFEWGV